MEPAWQAAAECLTKAAEREIAWMWFSRPAMMRALHGPDDQPRQSGWEEGPSLG
jgi:hypothetical protein